MTTIAIPQWLGRVSPVFDVARSILLVDIENGVEGVRREVAFEVESPHWRVGRLTSLGANVLVCGAISRPLKVAVAAAGIEVIPQICGDIDQVVAGFVDGRLRHGAFLMPGCGGRRRQFRGRCRGGGRWAKRPDTEAG